MILVTHSIVGASIANLFPDNPVLGFGLSFASHYVLDMIPHKDYCVDCFIDSESKSVRSIFNNMKAAMHFLLVALDLLAGAVICTLIFIRDENTLYLSLIGFIGGVLPDIFQFLYLKYKSQPFKFFQKIHDKVHNKDKIKNESILGYLNQVFTVLFFVSIYFFFK